MAKLPQATTTINDNAGALAGASDYIVILACAAQNADMVPRVFTSFNALLSEHGYCQGADYAALHIEGTKKPVIFCGLPCATAGVLSRVNSTGVTGSSAISISSAFSAGYMEETDSSITVVTGGTIGTNGITFSYSADGGRTSVLVRLGTASSYTVPQLGIVISFGGGTLNAGDVYLFETSAPFWASGDVQTAVNNLAAQSLLARSFMVIGEVANSTQAGQVTTPVNGYESANDRYVYARINVRDRLPLAVASRVKVVMSGAPNLTFDGTGHTITRSSGSWITDGFALNDVVTISGTVSNNITTGVITVLTATVMTFGSGLTTEGPVSGAAVVGSDAYIFDNVGHTVTRHAGSWLNDGFAIGDVVTFAGTASNDGNDTITNLSATVMTFGSGLVAETVRSDLVSVTKGETMSAWVSAMATAFASVDGQKRIDIGLGRARKISPITAWNFRRPVAWAASIREYSHTEQIPTWRKSDSPLLDWDLTDGANNVVEYDERSVGGALAARFTCFRTWANGPNGAFIALSLTRDTEGSPLSLTHNMAVVDVAQTVCQAATENAIGQVLVLKSDGTGTPDSLNKIAEMVNSQLQRALLQDKGEGALVSSARWTPATTDVLNVPNATLHGVLAVNLNGTLINIDTSIQVQTGG